MIVWKQVCINRVLQQQHDERYNPQDRSVEQTAMQTWQCFTDDLTAQPGDALTASAGGHTIPTIGAYYDTPAGPWFQCVHRFPKGSSGSFEVQVEFYRKIAFKPTGDKWALDISFSGTKFSEKAHKDAFGNAVINSAGYSFDPGRDRTYQDEVMEVSYKTVSPPDLRPWRSMVNSAAISFSLTHDKGGTVSRTYQPRQLLLDDGSMSTSVSLGDGTTGGTPSTPVWDVKLRFASRTVGANGSVDGYVDRVLNEGWNALTSGGPVGGGGINDAGLSYASLLTALAAGTTAGAGGGVRYRMLGADGQPLGSPGMLAADGSQLPVSGTPVFLAFAMENQADFSSIFTGF
jgi:hypothetical protein